MRSMQVKKHEYPQELELNLVENEIPLVLLSNKTRIIICMTYIAITSTKKHGSIELQRGNGKENKPNSH